MEGVGRERRKGVGNESERSRKKSEESKVMERKGVGKESEGVGRFGKESEESDGESEGVGGSRKESEGIRRGFGGSRRESGGVGRESRKEGKSYKSR